MTKNEKRLIKNGIVTPLIISIVLAIIYIASFGNFVFNNNGKTQITSSGYSNLSEITEFDGSPVADTISKSLLKSVVSNAIIGNIEIGNDSFDLINNADSFYALDRFNINVGSTLPGETGVCFADVYKNHASSIKLLAKGDTISINTFYSSYEYTVEDTYTAKNLHDLKNAGAGLGRALVLYTDNSVGAGISSEYFVCVATMKSGAKVEA